MTEYRTVELVGGPLDGETLPLPVDAEPNHPHGVGVALIAEWCAYPGGRSIYDPRPGDPDRLHWEGDVP